MKLVHDPSQEFTGVALWFPSSFIPLLSGAEGQWCLFELCQSEKATCQCYEYILNNFCQNCQYPEPLHWQTTSAGLSHPFSKGAAGLWNPQSFRTNLRKLCSWHLPCAPMHSQPRSPSSSSHCFENCSLPFCYSIFYKKDSIRCVWTVWQVAYEAEEFFWFDWMAQLYGSHAASWRCPLVPGNWARSSWHFSAPSSASVMSSVFLSLLSVSKSHLGPLFTGHDPTCRKS